jgi:hypothetical protein
MTYNEYIDGLGSMTPVLDTSRWSRYETEKDVQEYVDMYGYAHINPLSTQIDVDSVLWQLNNWKQRKMPRVTKKNLKEGQPWQDYKLTDQRDVPSPTPTPGGSSTWEII